MSNLNTILAIDPFGKNSSGHLKVTQVLRSLPFKDLQPTIEPVYVLGMNELNWVGNMSPQKIESFLPGVNKAIQAECEGIGGTDLKKYQILVNLELSKSNSPKALVEYATEQKAQLIALSTHAREGISRWILGSFAEDLLLSSKTPLLLVNPQTEIVDKPHVFFFPTDMSASSEKLYNEFIDKMQGKNCRIVIYSKIPHPIDSFVQPGIAMAGGGWVTLQQYLESEVEERKATLKKWGQRAQEKGFEYHVDVDDSPGYALEGILNAAELYKPSLMVVGSKAGAFTSAMFGSTGRQLVRHSPYPVWIQHLED